MSVQVCICSCTDRCLCLYRSVSLVVLTSVYVQVCISSCANLCLCPYRSVSLAVLTCVCTGPYLYLYLPLCLYRSVSLVVLTSMSVQVCISSCTDLCLCLYRSVALSVLTSVYLSIRPCPEAQTSTQYDTGAGAAIHACTCHTQ